MIALSFPNPNKKVTHHTPPWGGDHAKARRAGVSVYEYSKRCRIVEEQLKKLTYNVGDTLYPYQASLFHKHGKARVVAICRHFDDYGDVKWDDELPMLIAAHWEDKPNEVFNCTVLYLQQEPPNGVKTC